MDDLQTAAPAQPRLKGVIGPWGLTALVIGVTSPAIGLFATWGPIEAAAGPVAPLVFLAALLIILPTVLSYASLNRHAPSAGAAVTWLWTSVSPTVAMTAGLVMASYLLSAAITVPLLFGLFLRDLLEWLGVAAPGMAVVAAGVLLQSALVAWICLRGAQASIRTTIALMLLETCVVLALSATILWVKASQPGGINLGPFAPSHATQGLGGLWAAVILGMLAFSGFDVIAASAEEAEAPRTHVPRVLVLGVIGIGVFWALNSWVLTLSAAPAQVLAYNAQGLTAITPIARIYWGSGAIFVIVTAFTGLTAVYIATVQGASRILFAMARQDLLPAVLARVSAERCVPRAAVWFSVLTCVAVDLVSLLLLAGGLDAFVWWSGALVFFAAITFTGVNVANLCYFRRVLPGRFHLLHNLIVPVLGVGLSLYLLYAAFFQALWSQPFRTGRSVVIVCMALLGFQIAGVLWIRLSRPAALTGPAPMQAAEG